MTIFLFIVAVLAFIALVGIIALSFRIVVPTNDMHIVQSAKSTLSYGKDQTDGNVYYRWPAWIPVIGVRTIVLPVSVFSQNLTDYAAYDKGRVPFIIDIIAFFRITESNVAAQRVATVAELSLQLQFILKGVIRTILASSEIEDILEGRSKFGEMFTKEVDEQLKQWGVQTVKCIELMDIRDAVDSKVIANIMSKKKSLIEMQSRVEVAKNIQTAQTAEIDAGQAVKVREQEALQKIGMQTAEKDRQIGVANETAKQSIRDQEKTTAEKTMAVIQVQNVRKAEIERDVQVVTADQTKKTQIIVAEGARQQTILKAEGDLQNTTLKAQGIQLEGAATGAAETARLMAPVQTQITLAKEIGQNPGYQTYLVSIKNIEASQVVGIEQAHALQHADIKVIANTGNPVDGVKSAMELFTPKGGLQIGAALEALQNTPTGRAVVDALTGHKNGATEAR